VSRKGMGFRAAEMPGVIPVLSFIQPWPEAIFGGKNVENRPLSTKYRGPFWIHATMGLPLGSYGHAAEFIGSVAPSLVIPAESELVLGAVVGLSWITGVTDNRDLELTGKEPSNPWAFSGQFGWELDLSRTWRLSTPLAMPGAQSFWRLYQHETSACLARLPKEACGLLDTWRLAKRDESTGGHPEGEETNAN
jgi:hypothetical protein